MSGTSRPARRWLSRPLVLALALMMTLAACGDGDAATEPGGDADGPPASTSEVDIDGFVFLPADIEVPAGTTVTWTNQEPSDHTVQDSGDLFAESEILGEGDSFSFTYDTPGTYPYICGIHPFMTGTVTVT